MQARTTTPREQWRRSVAVLQVDGDIATLGWNVRSSIDHLQLARFEGRWVIVNALWQSTRKP